MPTTMNFIAPPNPTKSKGRFACQQLSLWLLQLRFIFCVWNWWWKVAEMERAWWMKPWAILDRRSSVQILKHKRRTGYVMEMRQTLGYWSTGGWLADKDRSVTEWKLRNISLAHLNSIKLFLSLHAAKYFAACKLLRPGHRWNRPTIIVADICVWQSWTK
jgi:hypothetical protein